MSKNNLIESRQNNEKSKIIEGLRTTPIIQIICQKTDVSRATYYRWRKIDKKFAQRCDLALQEGIELINDLAESQLLQAMKNQNLTAVLYWLNHRNKNYSNKIEVSGNLEVKKDELTKEQEENIKRALELASLITNKKGDQNEKEK